MYRWEMISPNKVVVRCTSDNNSNAGSRLRRELDFVHRLFPLLFPWFSSVGIRLFMSDQR